MSNEHHTPKLPGSSTQVHPGAQPFWLPGGPTGIILIHGFGGSIGDLRTLAEDLQDQGYAVFGTRVAGHGQGPDQLRQTTHQQWQASIEAAADFVGSQCQRVVLFGVSFGGALALDYTARHPDRVTAVITLNTPLKYQRGGPFQRILLRLLKLFTPYYKKSGLTADDYARMEKSGSLAVWPIASIFETYTIFDQYVKPVLGQIHTPALIMQTAQDQYVVTNSADTIAHHLASPIKRQIALPTTHHRPWLEPAARADILAKIQDFLATVLADSPRV